MNRLWLCVLLTGCYAAHREQLPPIADGDDIQHLSPDYLHPIVERASARLLRFGALSAEQLTHATPLALSAPFYFVTEPGMLAYCGPSARRGDLIAVGCMLPKPEGAIVFFRELDDGVLEHEMVHVFERFFGMNENTHCEAYWEGLASATDTATCPPHATGD